MFSNFLAKLPLVKTWNAKNMELDFFVYKVIVYVPAKNEMNQNNDTRMII